MLNNLEYKSQQDYRGAILGREKTMAAKTFDEAIDLANTCKLLRKTRINFHLRGNENEI